MSRLFCFNFSFIALRAGEGIPIFLALANNSLSDGVAGVFDLDFDGFFFKEGVADFELLDDTAHPDPSSVPPIILKQRAIASLDE